MVCLIFRLAEARKDALASVDLMGARYSRIVADETSKNGLVILIALYGRILSGKIISTTSQWYWWKK